MSPEVIAQLLAEEFRHPLLPRQVKAVAALSRFVATEKEEAAFILKGYAGTGKTSLVAALVRVLRQLRRPVVLLAPTGRAAKVFAAHAGAPAYTIHKVIYRQKSFNGEDTAFSLGFNKLRHALFIVDEASMLSNNYRRGSLFGGGQLLDDLIRFVYEGAGCRLLFVGDTAQLPPVGEEESPALQMAELQAYGLLVGEVGLTEVVRQSSHSGVLANATRLREMIRQEECECPRIIGSNTGTLRFLSGNELIESLYTAYHEYGTEDTIVVTRSNKRANRYNQGIRAQIFDREERLTRGDRIMVVKNNYHWAAQLAAQLPPEESLPFDFIANGDTAEVVRLRNVHEEYGFSFADATLRFTDYDDFELEARLLLSTLDSDSPSLTYDESQQLYENVLADYAHLPSKKERMQQLRQDPYYNALQVKYAYAVTCHKAQGGQWSRVFVDQGYLDEEACDVSYLRWLYTAFTRTTDRLYLINFPKEQQQVEE